ncbi:hypothetical protein HanXRQr2_Chr00c001g0832021 [Helianthus annuus]|nr:hypothetical protein HanXRQr2_Chr00c001g0832021 [Helianthus annuus]
MRRRRRGVAMFRIHHRRSIDPLGTWFFNTDTPARCFWDVPINQSLEIEIKMCTRTI